MAHITSGSISNADEALELGTLAAKGLPVHWPPIAQPATDTSGKKREGVTGPGVVEEEVNDNPYDYTRSPEIIEALEAQRRGESSAGISFSTYESRLDRSGSSAPETESSLLSPAPTAENPSSVDPASKPVQSSTAPSTSGSTLETGLSPADQSNSSEEPPTQEPSETGATPPPDGRLLVHQAREAYEAHNWQEARDLLEAAKAADSTLTDEVNMAMEAVQTAQSASEQTPSAGGFLVP